MNDNIMHSSSQQFKNPNYCMISDDLIAGLSHPYSQQTLTLR